LSLELVFLKFAYTCPKPAFGTDIAERAGITPTPTLHHAKKWLVSTELIGGLYYICGMHVNLTKDPKNICILSKTSLSLRLESAELLIYF